MLGAIHYPTVAWLSAGAHLAGVRTEDGEPTAFGVGGVDNAANFLIARQIPLQT
jgi:hypothetical protein